MHAYIEVMFPTRVVIRSHQVGEVMQSQTLIDHIYTANQEKYTSGGFTFAPSLYC